MEALEHVAAPYTEWCHSPADLVCSVAVEDRITLHYAQAGAQSLVQEEVVTAFRPEWEKSLYIIHL